MNPHERLQTAAEELVSALKALPRPTDTASVVFSAVHEQFGVSRAALRGRSKTKVVAWARHAAAHLLIVAGLSPAEAGHHLRRDKTTVMHSVRRVRDRLGVDKPFKAAIAAAESKA